MKKYSIFKSLSVSAVIMASLVMFNSEAHAQATVQTAHTVGDVIQNWTASSSSIKDMLSMIAYISGAFLAVQSLFKFKHHVEVPHQMPLSEPVKRFITGGMFLSLPFMVRAVVGTLFGGDAGHLDSGIGSSFSGGSGTGGLDDMVIMFMNDMWKPVNFLIKTFSIVAGLALLLVGISRLHKKMEEGPRGPAGMGTVMTFISAAALLSFSSSATAFSNSLFGDANVASNPTISTDIIADGTEQIESVLHALMGFIMLVGLVAFMRGWFVLKAFADGAQGATLAQGLTFLLGGTIAINLGDFLNVLSNTLGLTALSFS